MECVYEEKESAALQRAEHSHKIVAQRRESGFPRMDYLFDHPRPLQARLVSAHDEDDRVLLSKTLWDALNVEEQGEGKAAVAVERNVSRSGVRAGSGHASSLSSLVAYAKVDEKVCVLLR